MTMTRSGAAAGSPTRRTALAALGGMAIASLSGCDTAQALPDFGYTLLDGSRHDSRSLRGKVVWINFWSTTCAVCLRELPQWASTYERLRHRGFETLGVTLKDDAPARVSQVAQDRRLPFGVVIDNTGVIEDAFGKVRFTPTHVLVDRRGVIVARTSGATDHAAFQSRIESLLAAG